MFLRGPQTNRSPGNGETVGPHLVVAPLAASRRLARVASLSSDANVGVTGMGGPENARFPGPPNSKGHGVHGAGGVVGFGGGPESGG